MPVPPYQWQSGDFVTSAKLMQELRNFLNIGPLTPNGIGFHMKRPNYNTRFMNPGPGGSGSAITIAVNSTTTANPISSGMGFYGGDLLSAMAGSMVDLGALTNAGGGAAGGAPGGLYYTAGTIELMPGTTTAAGIAYLYTGAGNGYGNTLVQSSAGQWTDTASPSHTSNVWGASVIAVGNNNPTLAIRASNALNTSAGSGSDGSGQGTFLKGFWVGSQPGFGNAILTTSTLPTVSNWSGGVTAAALNSSIHDVMTLLNNPPVMQTAQNNAAINASANQRTPIVYTGAPTYDTYSAMNTTTGVYTIPLSGLYLITTFGGYDSTTSTVQGYAWSGVRINGGTGSSDYMGGLVGNFVATTRIRGASIRVFSLNAGDQVQQVLYTNYAGSVAANSADSPQMSIVWLGYNTAASPLPTLPDPTTQFTAGMSPAATQAAFEQLTNDLTFLTQRPYGLAYTATSGTSIPAGGHLTGMTTYTCPVHGDAANAWGGMNNGVFTAPVDGWYLCTGGYSATMTAPTTGNPFLYCGFQLSSTGANGADYWDSHRVLNSTTGNSGGSEAFGVYYLRAGDTCTIYANFLSATSGVTYTSTNPVVQTHFEAVWLSN